MMTDRECLMQLIQSLGLTRVQGVTWASEYCENPESIEFGCGLDGDPEMSITFEFDSAGKVVSHAILS